VKQLFTMMLLAALLHATSTLGQEVNTRPIIGILTQPLGTEISNGTSATNITYIAASYVKFLESAGARVVPIHYDSTRAELTSLFHSINGVLFPGGGADLSNTTLIRRSGQILYDLAIAANDAGDSFPLWGTCMGFQFLGLLTAQQDSILCADVRACACV
jgi:gamma-glutamyl hydrolase